MLPYVFLSIPAGILADRFDRRNILITTDLVRGALMVGIAAVVISGGPVEAIVALAIGAACASAFFGPAIGAYLPSLVDDEDDLGAANTAFESLNQIAFIAGPAIAAIIIATTDLALAFLLNAVSFGVVAVVLATLPHNRAGDSADDAEEAATAPSFDWRNVKRPLAALTVIDMVTGFIFGGLSVLTVIIGFELLGDGETGTGALHSAIGVGALIGTLVAGVLVLRKRLGPVMFASLVILGIGVAALGSSGILALAMVGIGIAAAGGIISAIVHTTLLQRLAPDEVRGRAFGVIETTGLLAYAAGSFLLPAFAVWFDLSVVLVVCGVGVIATGLLAMPLLSERQAPVSDPGMAVDVNPVPEAA